MRPCNLAERAEIADKDVQNVVSQCYFPRAVAPSRRRLPSTQLGFSSLPPSHLVLFLVLFMNSSVKIPVFLWFLIH